MEQPAQQSNCAPVCRIVSSFKPSYAASAPRKASCTSAAETARESSWKSSAWASADIGFRGERRDDFHIRANPIRRDPGEQEGAGEKDEGGVPVVQRVELFVDPVE